MVKLDTNELRFVIIHSVRDKSADVELALEILEKQFGKGVKSSAAVLLTERESSILNLLYIKILEFQELGLEVLNPTIKNSLLKGNERWSIESDEIQNRLALIHPFIERKVTSILLNMIQRAIELYQKKISD